MIYQFVLCQDASLVVVVLDHIEEVGIFGIGNMRKPLGNLPAISVYRSTEIETFYD
jgi:hypothetical protein